MNIARSLGDAILNPPARNSLRWWVSRTVPPAVATAEFVMAVATLLRYTDLGQLRHLLTTAAVLDKSVSITHVDPAVTLAVLAIAHIGGNRIMALLETLLKPLLNAQRAAGEQIGEVRGQERGRAEANAEFEAWKQRQRDAGVDFVEDEGSAEEPSNSER